MIADKRRFEPWPLALAAALALMIATSFAFLYAAVRYPDPVLVADSFAAEPALAQDLRARSRGAGLGWNLTVLTRRVDGGLAIDAALRDAAGLPIAAERVVARRERPAEGGLDTEVTLVNVGDRFRGDVPLPRTGRWQLVVRAERDGAILERTIEIRSPE